MMANGWNGYNNGGFDFFGWIAMMVALAVIIVAVVLTLRFVGRKGGANTHHETALEILKRRYANGEIDKQEYEEKKKELSE